MLWVDMDGHRSCMCGHGCNLKGKCRALPPTHLPTNLKFLPANHMALLLYCVLSASFISCCRLQRCLVLLHLQLPPWAPSSASTSPSTTGSCLPDGKPCIELAVFLAQKTPPHKMVALTYMYMYKLIDAPPSFPPLCVWVSMSGT